jgi:hypothetical protein
VLDSSQGSKVWDWKIVGNTSRSVAKIVDEPVVRVAHGSQKQHSDPWSRRASMRRVQPWPV